MLTEIEGGVLVVAALALAVQQRPRTLRAVSTASADWFRLALLMVASGLLVATGSWNAAIHWAFTGVWCVILVWYLACWLAARRRR